MMTTEQQKQVRILELETQIKQLTNQVEVLKNSSGFEAMKPKEFYEKYLKILEEGDSSSNLSYLDKQTYCEVKKISPTEFNDSYVGRYGFDLREFVGEGTFEQTGMRLVFFGFTAEVVDQVGGSEGAGEHWHSVIKVTSHCDTLTPVTRYFYIPGYYASYEGVTVDYCDIYEVTPFDKVVVDWKRL